MRRDTGNWASVKKQGINLKQNTATNGQRIVT